MQAVKEADLEAYVSQPVQICIHGEAEEDQAPWVNKEVSKVGLCPDKTHIRLYFDNHYFIAVPLNGKVMKMENKWTAYDEASGLYYSVKSEGALNE